MTDLSFPDLSECLTACLKDSISAETQLDGSVENDIDIDRVVTAFKVQWLYTNEFALRAPPQQACGSHLLVLHKNVRITNISLAEVISLLRLHARARGHVSEPSAVNFFSDAEYTSFLSNLLFSFFGDDFEGSEEEFEAYVSKVAETVAHRHSEFFKTTAIFETYFTTILVHIPISLAVDMASTVAESGYIHSAGYSLYVRAAEKAHHDQLTSALQSFVEQYKQVSPVFLTPYADEYFSQDDHEDNVSGASVRNGLDGIRIQLRKHYISTRPLRDFLNELASEMPEQLIVARGLRPHGAERRDSIEHGHATTATTIWIISDTKFAVADDGIAAPRSKTYLIVYAQYLRNNNQLIRFKERKPGWVAPVTLPHTLSIAMVNIVRAQLPGNKPHVIVDPFCGTGTSVIDCASRIPNAIVVGLDRNPLMPRMINDNMKFLSLEAGEIEELRDAVKVIHDKLEKIEDGKMPTSFQEVTALQKNARTLKLDMKFIGASGNERQFQNAILVLIRELLKKQDENKSLDQSIQDIIDRGFHPEFNSFLSAPQLSFKARMILFAVWRAIVNGRYALRGALDDLYSVIEREFEQLHLELDAHLRSLTTAEADELGSSVPNSFSTRTGVYSKATILKPEHFKAMSANRRDVEVPVLQDIIKRNEAGIFLCHVEDSVKSLKNLEGQVDAIITDPPYGFNTGELDVFKLEELYAEFIAASVRALRKGGQLICALPAYSRTGRQIPYFQTRGAFVRQFIAEVQRCKRKVSNLARTFPAPKDIYTAPFYWSSQKTLSRRIVWFTLE